MPSTEKAGNGTEFDTVKGSGAKMQWEIHVAALPGMLFFRHNAKMEADRLSALDIVRIFW